MLSSLLTAFLLGLMTIISPCPFCSNLTAIGFIVRDLRKSRVLLNSLTYTLGKILAYTALSLIFIFGAQVDSIQHFFETYGEPALGPFLILCGLFMLIAGKHEQHHTTEHNHGLETRLSILANRQTKLPQWLWSFILGFIFSLAFCPYSGVLYFGMLVPLTMAQPITWSWLMPLVYAIGTGLPVILITLIMSYTLTSITRINRHIPKIEQYLRVGCAILFIIIGIALILTTIFPHHH